MPLVHAGSPYLLDIVDEVFIVAEPSRVRAVTCDPDRWASWLLGAVLTSYEDRGPRGERWKVSGSLVGTAEVWLEEHGDGTVVHAYIRADLAGSEPPGSRRAQRRAGTDHVLSLKRGLFDVKDLLEGDRVPGTARVPLGERVVSASEQRPTSTTTEGASPDGRPDDLQHPDRR